MAKNRLVLFVFLLVSQFSLAQNGRFAIFFKDRAGTTFSVDVPLQYLSQRAIDRRLKNSVVISSEDFPINADYAAQIKNLGAEILHQSKWLNCIVAQLEGDELSKIMSLPFVVSSDYLGPLKSSGGGRTKRVNQKKDSNLNLVNFVQTTMLGLDDMHSENIFGEGVLIGVFDSGFIGVDKTDAFKSLFDEGRLTYSVDIVNKSGNVFQYDDHGTEVLSTMAGQTANYIGGVPRASYQLFVTEDVGSEFRIEEYNWLIAAEKADSAGVDIIHSSLGYNLFDDPAMDYATSQLDGKTAIVSIAASKALSKGIFVTVSAGNDGNTAWKLINPPADADGVMAVGSITSTGSLASFSSTGPTSDARIKPEVVALGSGVSVIKASGATGFTSGTSASAPLVSGLAAGLMQAYPILTATEIYDLIIKSGSMSTNPDNQKGYGIPHYLAAKKIMNPEEPHEPSNTIYLFPNPAGDEPIKVLIDVSEGQSATISIYDLQGKLVMQSEGEVTFTKNPVEIDVRGFSSGIYIVKVETKGVLKTIRLVKL